MRLYSHTMSCYFAVLGLVGVSTAQLTEDDRTYGPVNTASDLTGSVTLTCTATLGIDNYQWHFGEGVNKTMIFDGDRSLLDKDIYRIDNPSDTEYNLVMWNLALVLSGAYVCTKRNGTIVTDSTAQLVLMGRRISFSYTDIILLAAPVACCVISTMDFRLLQAGRFIAHWAYPTCCVS